uniref:Uncharacterized protein n=1 Tax=Strigamia maritima TaxID=126957 RepID=T1IMF5_STRMM
MKFNAFSNVEASLPSIRFGLYDHAKYKCSHFFFIMLSMATSDLLDVGNIIFKAYEGGMSFWILYFAMYMSLGLPLVYLECQMGQFFGQTNLNILRHMCPVSTGVGMIQLLSLCFYLIRHNIHLGLLIHYFFSASTFSVPWTKCGHYWSSKNCFTMDQWLECSVKDGRIFWNNTCYLPHRFCEAFDANLTSLNGSFCAFLGSGKEVAMLDLVTINHTTPGKDYYQYVTSSSLGSGFVDTYTLVYYTLAWIITCTSGYKGIHAATIPV